jgi:creatinine amidohydrolase/Fe(II)-dependent formamide hydrolase-like protein
MRYPGTISLRAETFQAVLVDVGESLLAHGFEHIVYIGDSGGNQRGMAAAATAINEKKGEKTAFHIPEFYDYASVSSYMNAELGVVETADDGIHDNFYITSIMMAVDPTVVRYEQRVSTDKATINGLSIAPKEATIEVGRKLIKYRADLTVKAIKAAIGS